MKAVHPIGRSGHYRQKHGMARDCIYIIDTFSLMFQVFHAIPPMTGTKGQPTNAVFGFTRDIFAILDRKPTHLVCALDSPGPGKRDEIYDQYKANRAEIPEDLRPQIPLIKTLLDGFRIPGLEVAGWEADDVIATVTRQAVERDMDVVIVSTDKDARQLLGPHVRMLNCRKNTFLDVAGLKDDWGIGPEQVVDYQSLVGDSVDNVPGVPKIGPKTARTLIEQFGTLEQVLANADKAPGKKVQENLVAFADQARLSRELVRLRDDLPMTLDFEAAKVCEPDHQALYDFFNLLGFRRYAAQMRESLALKPESDPVPVKPTSLDTAKPLLNLKDVDAALKSLSTASTVYVEAVIGGTTVRTRHLSAIAISDGQTLYTADLAKTQLAGAADRILDWLAGCSAELVTSSAKPLCHALLNAGRQLPGKMFDASIADYLLDAGAATHNLAEVVDRHATDAVKKAALSDARRTRQKTMFDDEEDDSGDAEASQIREATGQSERQLRLLVSVRRTLQQGLESDDLLPLYRDLEEPLIRVLAKMEHTGITVDVSELKKQSQTAAAAIDVLTEEIHAAAGKSFNIDSPKQLATVLFTDLKLPVLRKTMTGASTDQEVLEELALMHPLPKKIIERRQLVKLKGTYLDALPELVNSQTGRIHATFDQTVAATGRLSSSDPNLQNIPIRTPEGKRVRAAFRPGSPDWTLICADYSQIELRVLAHFSGDAALKDAFAKGIDIHAAVASEVFHTPLERVSSDQRRMAKAVNFGVIYGQTPWGLAAGLGIEKDEAAAFIENYFRTYSGVAKFCEKVLTETSRTGFARTILNRRRAISGIRRTTGINRNMPERTAINTVIQGSAADLIKKAMLDVDAALTTGGLQSRLLLQIHDELVFEAPQNEAQSLIELVRERMQKAMVLDVPLEVDVTMGANWLDQTDV